MVRENNYDVLLNNINRINKPLTKEEKHLLDELKYIVQTAKTYRMIEYIVESHDRLYELLLAINEKLKEYIESRPQTNITQNKIDSLNSLKTDIISFKRELYKNSNLEENNLLEQCFSYLTNNSHTLPSYFGENLASKKEEKSSEKQYILNNELISKLQELLSKDNIIDEIKQVMRISTTKKECMSIINTCMDSLSYKENLLNNIEDVLNYNKLEEQIGKVFEEGLSDKYVGVVERENKTRYDIEKIESNPIKKALLKKKLEILKKEEKILLKRKNEYSDLEHQYVNLTRRIQDIKTKLKENNLLDIVSRSDISSIATKPNNQLALTSILRSIKSKEELEVFYNKVEEALIINKELLEKTNQEEMTFNNTASKEVIDLINNDYTTVENLSKISDKVDPKILLFILETISIMKEYKPMYVDKKSQEYKMLKEHYDDIINSKIYSYDRDYIDVLDGKKYVK